MYRLNLPDPNEFLRQYWQKQPCIIRNAFLNFTDPLDEHELAGLAQEELDSRIISQRHNRWQVDQGPFDDFAPFCVGDWTLLVQGVDTVCEPAKALLSAFDFIPMWRVDDLMVSYSVKNGGVGPHLDQYDVFIIQGKGTRRWQVGAKADYPALYPHPKLSQIADFSPIIDEVLAPGDMVYIPPGFPHNGIAIEPCLNYSVGFRAPTQQELLLALADYADETPVFIQRYEDPDLLTRSVNFEIKQPEIARFRQMMHQMIDSAHFSDFLARFLTKQDTDNLYDIEEEQEITMDQLNILIENNTVFHKDLTVKLVAIRPQEDSLNNWNIYINSEHFSVPEDLVKTVTHLLNQSQFTLDSKFYYENSLFFVPFLSRLVNSGYWYPEE